MAFYREIVIRCLITKCIFTNIFSLHCSKKFRMRGTLQLLMCAYGSTNKNKYHQVIEEKKKKKKLRNVSNIMCHVSCVICYVSCNTCFMSPVTCHLSLPPTAIAIDPPRLGADSVKKECHEIFDKKSRTQETLNLLNDADSWFDTIF